MNKTKEYTLSDKELNLTLVEVERKLKMVKPTSWTAGKLNESLNYIKAQLALPRGERCKYMKGSI